MSKDELMIAKEIMGKKVVIVHNSNIQFYKIDFVSINDRTVRLKGLSPDSYGSVDIHFSLLKNNFGRSDIGDIVSMFNCVKDALSFYQKEDLSKLIEDYSSLNETWRKLEKAYENN